LILDNITKVPIAAGTERRSNRYHYSSTQQKLERQ